MQFHIVLLVSSLDSIAKERPKGVPPRSRWLRRQFVTLCVTLSVVEGRRAKGQGRTAAPHVSPCVSPYVAPCAEWNGEGRRAKGSTSCVTLSVVEGRRAQGERQHLI